MLLGPLLAEVDNDLSDEDYSPTTNQVLNDKYSLFTVPNLKALLESRKLSDFLGQDRVMVNTSLN